MHSPETDQINEYEVASALPEGKLFKYKDMNFRIAYQFKKGKQQVLIHEDPTFKRYLDIKFLHIKNDFYFGPDGYFQP